MEAIVGGKIIVLWGRGDTAASLRPALAASGLEVVEAESGEDALGRAAKERPAAVLLDLDNADDSLDDTEASGFLVCKLMRERYGELLPIVVLSGERMQPAYRVLGLLLGADDYVVKPFSPSEVVARIRRLVARANSFGATDRARPHADAVDNFDLTKREQQIMVLLLQGLTQSEIARQLVISPNTVATHIQRILMKLGVHNRAQAVAKVAQAGWLQRHVPLEEPSSTH